MIGVTILTALASFALGFITFFAEKALGTTYMQVFLAENLVSVMIGLLAINSATMGIVLTKIRDLVSRGHGTERFRLTRQHMLHSIHEQIALILISVALLIMIDEKVTHFSEDIVAVLKSAINGVFFYALWILYDTARGVLIIIDFDADND